MAFNYSPKIVTDGLVLYLDAANTKSYPGSGTVWTDLSRNGNNGTLVNMGSTGFSSSNGGVIVFDGINDYIDLPTITFNTNPFTIDLWFKINGNQTANSSLLCVAAAGTANNWQLSFINNVELLFFYRGIGLSNAFNLNYTFVTETWTNVIITKNTSNNIISYVNGVQTNSVTYASNYNNTEPLRIGLNRSQTDYYKGNISACKIYLNKSLSSSEILQNYNTIKSRFGLT
jgi:hypothetical protein